MKNKLAMTVMLKKTQKAPILCCVFLMGCGLPSHFVALPLKHPDNQPQHVLNQKQELLVCKDQLIVINSCSFGSDVVSGPLLESL